MTSTLELLPNPVRTVAGEDEAPTSGLYRTKAALLRVGRGLGVLVPIVFVATFVTYAMGALSNTDPAATILGQSGVSPAALKKLNDSLGLNRPLLVQYWHWLVNALHGNLGRSYFSQIAVSHSIAQRLPVDLSIAGLAVVIAVVLGGAMGILAGTHRGSWLDRGVTMVCSAVSTLPAFVVGIILVVLFATTIKLVPGSGYVGPTTSIPQWLRHIILPSLALALQVAVDIARQLRTSLVRVLEENYVVGAEVRGLSRRRVLFRHALRNAAGPAVTVLGIDVPMMIAGAVAAEEIFSLPGMGQLVLESAQTRDIPVVQGVLLVTSTLVIVANLVVNGVLTWLHPSQGR
jgi:peptide/nickel transport system permease protein